VPEKNYHEQNCVWDQNFDILGVNFWKLLEMALFISPNTFLGVGKHDVFGRNIGHSWKKAYLGGIAPITERSSMFKLEQYISSSGITPSKRLLPRKSLVRRGTVESKSLNFKMPTRLYHSTRKRGATMPHQHAFTKLGQCIICVCLLS
jgi:hypothetical protein